ncbi:MAG: hemerythrin domain-containing protein [Rhodoplanes sp.]
MSDDEDPAGGRRHPSRPGRARPRTSRPDLLAVEAELRGAADRARLATLLDRLIEFTNIHFMSEQLVMRQQAYPGLPAHEAEHDQLMDQMRDFQTRIASGERTLTAADLSTLREWVLRHIRSKDTAFANYLGELATAPPAPGAESR